MEKNFSFNKSLVIMILIAILVGGLSGGVAGLYVSTLTSGSGLFGSAILRPAKNAIQNEKGSLANGAVNNDVQEQNSVVSAVKKASPAVVSIVVSKYVTKYYGQNNLFPDDFFNNFNLPFGFQLQIPTPQQPKQAPQTEKQEVGGGTGFIISSADGLILTNKHVVADETADYTVVTNDGQKISAKVLARDPFNDIAVLKINKSGLPEVQLGDSDKLQIGQTVIAIGNALGQYRNTVTRGIISGIGRDVVAGDNTGQSENLQNIIQTDAAINPGNSGGPLINLAGQVVGINSAINQSGQLIGFSIPINQAKQAINSVKKSGKIVRAYLGVRYVVINDAIAQKNKLSVNYGALIIRGQAQEELAIIPGSPADKAGLVENDIILEVNGQKINEQHPLSELVQNSKPGDILTLKVLDKGKEKMVKVTLEEYKS